MSNQKLKWWICDLIWDGDVSCDAWGQGQDFEPGCTPVEITPATKEAGMELHCGENPASKRCYVIEMTPKEAETFKKSIILRRKLEGFDND